jgi:hypothetical protein
VANGSTLAIQNVVNQVVLVRTLPPGGDRGAYLRPYVVIAGATGLLLLLQILVAPAFVVALAICAVAGLAVLRLTRHSLLLTSMFPELRKVPGLSAFVA